MWHSLRAPAVPIITAAILLLLSTASLSQRAGIAFEVIDPALAPYGAVDGEAVWTRAVISVCWLNHPEYSAERLWVREAIQRTWEEASGVQFTWWRDCSTSQAFDIPIYVDESGPRSYVGQHVIGHSPAMWLNFSFATWGKDCQTRRESCIKAIAVHEFGHALGFQHEQLQADAPQACIDHLKQSGEWETVDKKPVALTPYDANSVMNYCNSIWANNGNLSPNDIRAIKVLFPQ
jgi:hypothetical protein